MRDVYSMFKDLESGDFYVSAGTTNPGYMLVDDFLGYGGPVLRDGDLPRLMGGSFTLSEMLGFRYIFA